MGDYANWVTQFLKECDALSCDVFVAACNDHFVRPFTLFTNYQNTIIRKAPVSIASLQATNNATDAATIVSLI